MYKTVSEVAMQATIISLLESENNLELANLVRMSKIVYLPQWEFSGVVSNQKKLLVEVKVPVNMKSYATSNESILSRCACDIYEDDDEYACYGVKIGTRAIIAEEIEFDHKKLLLEKDSVYTNFIKYLSENTTVDNLQKQYLYEACTSGNAKNLLSASVMLGCAAEILLKNLCESFYKYYLNHKTSAEQTAFEQKVIKAKVAYNRLDEFTKRAEANPEVFKQFGFENLRLNFNFLDIIRQTRNDAGHPTGKRLEESEFKTMLGNYQLLLGKCLVAVKQLPTI